MHLRVVNLQARADFFTAGLYCMFSGSSSTTVLYVVKGTLSAQFPSPMPKSEHWALLTIAIYYIQWKRKYIIGFYWLVGQVVAGNSSVSSLEGWSEQVFGFSSFLCPGTCKIRIQLFYRRQHSAGVGERKSTKKMRN